MTIEEYDIQFMNRAIVLSKIAKSKGEDPFGAVLVKENVIVHESHDGCIEFCDPTLHAERRLISEYCSKNGQISLEGYTLYSSAEPCVMCSGAIRWSRISRVVFGVSQEKLNKLSGGLKKMTCEELVNQGKKKICIVGPVLEEDALSVFQSYVFRPKVERVQQGLLKEKEDGMG